MALDKRPADELGGGVGQLLGPPLLGQSDTSHHLSRRAVLTHSQLLQPFQGRDDLTH